MPERVDVAIVGAGPFGLSLASFFEPGRARVFGQPMKTWRTQMPPEMQLRSAWEETSLASPGGRGSIDAWADASGEGRQEPIPLQAFLSYADWFRERFVGDHDPADVTHVRRSEGGFRVNDLEAGAVVLAVGVTPFSYAPPPFRDVVGDEVTFAIARQRSLAELRGKRVVVVGAGQAGLETAGIAAREGGDVEMIARSRVRWFADREPHHPRGPLRRRLYRLAYPAVGYGPPPINRLVLHPDLFASLPRGVRSRLTARLLRPGGSPWVRSLVEGKVRVTEGRTVCGVERRDGMLALTLDDGEVREADAVVLATGYRFSLDRLAFLSPELRAEVELDGGFPKLDRHFNSTARGLLFVGYPAEGRFGPLSRFVLGTEFTSPRVRRAFA